jgi:hypothetical protein
MGRSRSYPRKERVMPGYPRHEIKARILLRLRRGEPISTEQLAADMRTAYSSTREALMELKATKEVCIVKWTKTGAHPIRFWGIGTADAPKPPPLTREQQLERSRERKRLTRIIDAADATPIARRDPAASWF